MFYIELRQYYCQLKIIKGGFEAFLPAYVMKKHSIATEYICKMSNHTNTISNAKNASVTGHWGAVDACGSYP